MKEVCLFLSMFGVFAIGNYIMEKVDEFLEKNQQEIEAEHEQEIQRQSGFPTGSDRP